MQRSITSASLIVLGVAASLICCYAANNSAFNVSSDLTAYEVLESYGFPSGLLPLTVVSYTLDSDGSFTLTLEGSCIVNVDSYRVKYASEISGVISTGSITDLSGITVRVLFIWWKITSITVSGSNLVFKVASISKSFAISNFIENPVCENSVRALV